MSVVRNLTTPYVWNWTLNVQHAFAPNVTLEVGYVGNHGANLVGFGTSIKRRRAQPRRPPDRLTRSFPTSAIFFRWETSTDRTTTDFKQR